MWSAVASLAVLLGSPLAAPPKVAALVGQLGSPDFRAREAASKELEAVGLAALPSLRAAAASPDMEVARRAAEVAARIARRLDNEKALAPTLVELDAENARLAEVLAALEKQAGCKLVVADPAALESRVTVKTGGKVSFWEAASRVAAAAGLEVGAPGAGDAPVGSAAASRAAGLRAARDRVEQLRLEVETAEVKLLTLQVQLARVERVGGNGSAEEKKRIEDAIQQARREQNMLRVKAAQVEKELALMELAGRQLAALDHSGRRFPPPPQPADPGVFALRPKSGKPNPACVSGAVRVEAVPYPAAALTAVPKDTIPVSLAVAAEPRLNWLRVESVRLTRATDEAGRELARAADPMGPRIVPVQGGYVVLDAAGGAALAPGGRAGVSYAGLAAGPQGHLALKAGDSPPKVLKSLEGIVRGVVRAGPEELAAVAGLEARPSGSAAGLNGVGLIISGITELKDEPGAFEVSVTTRYTQADVQPAGASQPDETIMLQGRGRVMVRGQARVIVMAGGPNGRIEVAHTPDGRPQATVAGIAVTDAAGQPFALHAVIHRRQLDQMGGVADQVKLIARPTDKTHGKPARVSFSGTHAKTVDVPFKLADVPVAAGLGESLPPPVGLSRPLTR